MPISERGLEVLLSKVESLEKALHDSVDKLFKTQARLDEAEKVIDTLWENEPDKTEMLDILQEYQEKYCNKKHTER